MYASPEAQFIVTGTTDTDTTDIIIDRSLRPSARGARLRYYSILSGCSILFRCLPCRLRPPRHQTKLPPAPTGPSTSEWGPARQSHNRSKARNGCQRGSNRVGCTTSTCEARPQQLTLVNAATGLAPNEARTGRGAPVASFPCLLQASQRWKTSGFGPCPVGVLRSRH